MNGLYYHFPPFVLGFREFVMLSLLIFSPCAPKSEYQKMLLSLKVFILFLQVRKNFQATGFR